MKFGYFDDANKEYVITSPKTPLPWINYLGSENFFSLISILPLKSPTGAFIAAQTRAFQNPFFTSKKRYKKENPPQFSRNYEGFSWRSRRDLNPRAVV